MGKYFNPSLFIFSLSLLVGLNGVASEEIRSQADVRSGDLSFRLMSEMSSTPLTTEQVWVLDPDASNPHRRRWVVEKKAELAGLHSVPQLVKMSGTPEKFQVVASDLVSTTRVHLRGPGQWYRPFSEFPCTRKSESWFSTEGGSRIAAEAAAADWNRRVREGKQSLSRDIQRVSAPTEKEAIAAAQQVFESWRLSLEQAWRADGLREARDLEWRAYLNSAQQSSSCPKIFTARIEPNSKNQGVPPEQWMEPVPTAAPMNKLLARAPARRWNGVFSVRLVINFDGKKLNGQFLLDSSAVVSSLSPTWLKSQGINPVFLELAGRSYKKKNERVVGVQSVDLSGYNLPLREFVLKEADFFTPPNYMDTCCDGILGTDFFRSNVVEFDPGQTPEIRLWDRKAYRESASTPWVELVELSTGQLASDCLIAPEDATQNSAHREISGVAWATAFSGAIAVHNPWKNLLAGAQPATQWKINCFGKTLGTARAAYVKSEFFQSESQLPGTSVGMEFLSRGPFSVDMPHGRLWLSKVDASHELATQDGSGLDVEYVFEPGGKRVLKVLRIRPKSPAQALARMGLREGSSITKIGPRSVDDVDLAEAKKMLSGDLHRKLTLEWKTGHSMKSGSLPETARQ